MNKLRVYCETSFWSYLTGRNTTLEHIAVKQAATLRWWQEIAPNCEIYVSPYVDDEVMNGNLDQAEARAKVMADALSLDGSVPEVIKLATDLLAAHALPEKEATDASHIATAAVYGMDVLLTWNCKHMANPVTLPKTASVVYGGGFKCPVIITPKDFLERREEFGL